MPADEPDPPRKFYEFKPREFERVNPPAPVAPRAPSLIKGTRPVPKNKPITVEDILREANAGQPAPGADGQPAAKNDVHGHLKTNLDGANAAGLNDLKPFVPRPSRRKRDYWTLMIAGNAFFIAVTLLGRDNPMVFASGVAGAALFSVSVTWVMWFIMDRH